MTASEVSLGAASSRADVRKAITSVCVWQGGWGRGGNNKVRWVIWIVSFVGYKVTMDTSFGASVREPAERVDRGGRTHPECGWQHSIG